MGTEFGDEENREIMSIAPLQTGTLSGLAEAARELRLAGEALAKTLLLHQNAELDELRHVRGVYDDRLFALNRVAYDLATTIPTSLVAAIIADYARINA